LISALTSLTCSCLRRRAGGRARGEEFGLGDELDGGLLFGLVPEEAFGQRCDGDREALVAALELGERSDARRLDAAVTKQLEQAFAPALRLGNDQHAVARGADVDLQFLQRLGGTSVDPEVGQRPGPGRIGRTFGASTAQAQGGVRGCQREEVIRLQEEIFGRQDRPFAVVLQEPVALARVGPEALQRLIDLAVQHQRRSLFRARLQVLEDRRRLVEEQRQVVLDSCCRDAGGHVLVEAHLRRVALDTFAPAGPERGARLLVHRKLAARQQSHLGHRIQAALAVGVEGSYRVDLVAEQVDPVRHQRAHREQVDQSTAHRIFAG
jgi:hypothetical protein